MTATEIEQTIPNIEQFLDAIERGDVETAIAAAEPLLHPEIEFTSAIGSEVDGRSYIGTAGLREWFQEFSDTFDVDYGDRRFRVFGDGVLLGLFTMRLRGRSSGAEVIRQTGTVWELEDGVVVRATSYASQDQATKAAEAVDA
jgi:ketosteroid isomerase-like protein